MIHFAFKRRYPKPQEYAIKQFEYLFPITNKMITATEILNYTPNLAGYQIEDHIFEFHQVKYKTDAYTELFRCNTNEHLSALGINREYFLEWMYKLHYRPGIS